MSDNTFTSGFFGFYNQSQRNVVYKGFTEELCNYSVSPASQPFTASGGAGVVSITAPDTCDWTAVSNDSWITITSASTGSGNGSINYSVLEKLSTGSRIGTITIAGETFTVTQEGGTCTFSITPASQAFITSAAGAGIVSVTAAPGSCDWTAISNASWITVTSGSTGTGNGGVGFSVSENTSVVPRTATITIAEETFTVTQAGKVPSRCTYSITPTQQAFAWDGGTDSISVEAPNNCNWTAISNNTWITIDSGNSGNGNGTVNYSVSQKLSAGSRTGTITIKDETFTVTQVGSGVCTFTITPTSQTIAAASGTDSVDVTATPPGSCDWTAITNASWITVTSGNTGSGNGSVSYSVSENTSIFPRTAIIDIAEQTYTVTQTGAGPDIRANGSDGPVITSSNLSVTVALTPGTLSGDLVDWWLAADTPLGWFYYNLVEWVFIGDISGLLTTHQGPLFDLTPPIEVLNISVSGLPSGTYRFYFAVDTDMNGVLDLDKIVFDLVEVIVP